MKARLSLVIVVGLLADLMLGAWWVDAVTSLVIVGFVVKEAREAWSGRTAVTTTANSKNLLAPINAEGPATPSSGGL
jgi:hypothetical protein